MALTKSNEIGELVGISRFQHKFLELVFSKAQEDFQNGKLNYHYEECVYRTRMQTIPIHAVADKDLARIEIYTAEDLQKARELVYPRISDKSQQK